MLYEYKAAYLSNYDGDTIKFKIDLGFNIFHVITVRLLRIDTYELKEKNKELKEVAYDAKQFTELALKDAKTIIITTFKDDTDKYGRYLAEVIYDGVNLSNALFNAGLAKTYLEKK
jgi:endonuclease YncB( thermonuclease family)